MNRQVTLTRSFKDFLKLSLRRINLEILKGYMCIKENQKWVLSCSKILDEEDATETTNNYE